MTMFLKTGPQPTTPQSYQAWQYEFTLDRLKQVPGAVIDNVAILVANPCFEENRKLHKRIETKLKAGMPDAESHLFNLVADSDEEHRYSMISYFAREVNKLREGGFNVDLSEAFKKQLLVLKLRMNDG